MTNLMKRSALALLVAAAVTITGCADAKRPAPEGELPIDPNPPAAEAPAESQMIVLYFADWQAQHVIPEARYISSQIPADQLPTEIVKELLQGPTDPHLLRALPESVRLVRDVYQNGRTLFVDLSEDWLHIQGSAGRMMAVNSLRYSLGELPGVDYVHIMVEGEDHDIEISGPHGVRDLTPWPVLVDEERIAYLQAQVDQGKETWRLDAAETLLWEGRMFGFTQDELKEAAIEIDGNQAITMIESNPPGKTYAVVLSRNSAEGIWYVSHFETVNG